MGNYIPMLFSGKLSPHSLLLPCLSFDGIFPWCVSQWYQFTYKAFNSCCTLKEQHSFHWNKYILFSFLCSRFAGVMKIVIKRIVFFFTVLSAVKEAVISLAAAAAARSLYYLNCLVISGCSVIMIAMHDNDTKLMVDVVAIDIKTDLETKKVSWFILTSSNHSKSLVLPLAYPHPTSETPH